MVKGMESVTVCPGCAPTIDGMVDLLEGTICSECESSVASVMTSDGRMICAFCHRIEEGLQSQAQVDREDVVHGGHRSP